MSAAIGALLMLISVIGLNMGGSYLVLGVSFVMLFVGLFFMVKGAYE